MNTRAPIQLLVLDDHEIVRQGVMLLLRQLPWIADCRGAASTDDALRLLDERPADAAVVDLSLKRESGLDAIERLLQRHPALCLVVLTMHADALHRECALQRGARGFVAKDDAADELAEALQRTLDGHRYVSRSAQARRVGDDAGALQPWPMEAAVARLTARERQVLALIGRGQSAAEVATALGRSIKTVEAHRNNLREKLGLRNNRELLQFSARWTQLDT